MAMDFGLLFHTLPQSDRISYHIRRTYFVLVYFISLVIMAGYHPFFSFTITLYNLFFGVRPAAFLASYPKVFGVLL